MAPGITRCVTTDT